jgi:hypothetical protein
VEKANIRAGNSQYYVLFTITLGFFFGIDFATEKAMEIIENHQPYPLPAGTAEIMDEMVAEFETRLKIEHDD